MMKTVKNGLMALGALAVLVSVSPAAHAAAIGVGSPAAGPVTQGNDSFDMLQVTPISNSTNQETFVATLDGSDYDRDWTQGFAYYTDSNNRIRDILFIDFNDDGHTSTLYFNYVAHGNFGTVNAPTGSIVDPRTQQVFNLKDLPTIPGVNEAMTHVDGGYVMNGDLRDVANGEPTGMVPYLAIYIYADEPAQAAAPEPASLLLLPVGLAGAMLFRRKRASN